MATMMNFFAPASEDKSLEYLFRIFGDMNGLLAPQGTTLSLFGELFRVFNTIALTIGTLIVVYATVVGVLKTAAEGEFLGRQWNSLWVPLRMVLGIASLVPTPSGYSGLQIVMMWVIMQGIGAADTVWRTALATISVVKSPYTKSIILPATGMKQNMESLFKVVTCNQSLHQPQSAPYTDKSFDYGLCGGSGQPSCTPLFTPANAFERNQGTWNPNNKGSAIIQFGYCGQLQLTGGGTCPGGDAGGFDGKSQAEINAMLQCRSANSQLAAVGATRELFEKIAEALLKVDYVYLTHLQLSIDLNTYRFMPVQYKATFAALKKLYTDNPFLQQACDQLIEQGLITSTKGGSHQEACINASTVGIPMDSMGFPPSLPDSTGARASSQARAVKLVYYPGVVARVPSMGKGDFIQVATDNYISAIAKPVLEYKQWLIQKTASGQMPVSGALKEAEKNGWMFAGAYYYLLSKDNASATDAAEGLTFNVKVESPTSNPKVGSYYNNITTADLLITAAKQAGSGAFGQTSGDSLFSGQGTSAGAKGFDLSKESMNQMVSSWKTTINEKQADPLVALQQWGWSLLFIVPMLWGALVVLFGIASVAVSIDPYILGSGIGNPGREPYWTILLFLLPIFFGLFMALIGIGGLIGIYTPFLPYIIFITGALGWIISIVETMVAGPLVALGILAPGGHHDVLGKAEPALMLLFNNFLRPTLMIFGLFAAMLIAPVAMDILNSTFDLAMTSIASMGNVTDDTLKGADSSYTGRTYVAAGTAALVFNPVAAIFMLCVYVMLVLALLNKCFAAIHIIPERVMAWIGGQGAQYGESEVMGEAKRGSEGAAHGMTTSMGESKGGVSSAAGGQASDYKQGHHNKPDQGESTAADKKNDQGGGTP